MKKCPVTEYVRNLANKKWIYFPANLRDTRTSFREPLGKRTISSSLSRSRVTSPAAMQANLLWDD